MKLFSRACIAFLALFAVASAAQPNIVFIMTDQHSADALSCRMGDRYVKTPALDRLAARGTFFSRAYTPNPLCMPARNSIFTGRYPHETGITDNTKTTLDAAEFVTMGTYFRQAGYQTAYYGKWHLAYDEGATKTHGFETLETGHIDAGTAAKASAFLSRKHHQPFLLVVSFLNPHNVCELARGQDLNNGPIGEPPPVAQRPPPPVNLAPPRNEPDTMARIRAGYHANPQFPVGNFSPQMWQAGRGKPRSPRRRDARRRREAARVRRRENAQERGPIRRPLQAEEEKGTRVRSAAMKLRARFFFFIALSSSAVAAAGSTQPNIVVILADDFGWGSSTPYGAKGLNTPNLDRLAREGRRFTNAYAPSSVCSPSRYGLMTGRYYWRTSIKDGEDSFNVLRAFTEPTPGAPVRDHFIMQASDGTYALRLGDWRLVERIGAPKFERRPDAKTAKKVHAGPKHDELFNLKDDPSETRDLSATHADQVAKMKRLRSAARDRGFTRTDAGK